MMKKVLLAFLASISVISLVSCGDNTEPKVNKSIDTSSKIGLFVN